VENLFNQSAWLQLTILMIAFLALSLVLAVVWMLVKAILNFLQGKTIKTNMVSISAVREEGFSEDETETVETAVDYVNLLLQQNFSMSSIWRIKDVEILREQMSYIEDRLDIVLLNLETVFCKYMATEKSGQNYMCSPEYLSFRMLIEVLKNRLLSRMRGMCKENHFIEKSDKEFKEYADIHFRILVDTFHQAISMFSPAKAFLRCEEHIKSTNRDLEIFINESLYRARDIAGSRDTMIKKIQNEFDASCVKVLGHTIKGVI
jgi:hypothetical protein